MDSTVSRGRARELSEPKSRDEIGRLKNTNPFPRHTRDKRATGSFALERRARDRDEPRVAYITAPRCNRRIDARRLP